MHEVDACVKSPSKRAIRRVTLRNGEIKIYISTVAKCVVIFRGISKEAQGPEYRGFNDWEPL